MATVTYVHLTSATRIEAHDAAGVPYINVYPDGVTGDQVALFLGHGSDPRELDIAEVQLRALDAAIGKARQLIAATRIGRQLTPDEPTDEPTDEPDLAAGDHFAYPASAGR